MRKVRHFLRIFFVGVSRLLYLSTDVVNAQREYMRRFLVLLITTFSFLNFVTPILG